jgi:hypothetical protein
MQWFLELMEEFCEAVGHAKKAVKESQGRA